MCLTIFVYFFIIKTVCKYRHRVKQNFAIYLKQSISLMWAKLKTLFMYFYCEAYEFVFNIFSPGINVKI